MPVHQDDEYRIGLEKEALLKRLGITMDSEEYRQMTLSSTLEKTDSDRARTSISKRANWPQGEVGTNIVGLLRILVMQNELILYALKRLEDVGTTRPRPFNPADWK